MARYGTWRCEDFIDLSDGGGETWALGVSVPAVVTIHAGGSGSLVNFGTSMTISGPDYAIAFGSGNAWAAGCQGSVWVPVGQTLADHCK